MADSTSLSRFLSLETDIGLPEEEEDDEEEDELNEYCSSSILIEDEQYLFTLLAKQNVNNHIESHVVDWIIISRSEAIQWIFNTRSCHQFKFHTAYLSVTYIDRFLSKQHITSEKPWAIRLLAIACLSLAAKMHDRKKWEKWRESSIRTQEFEFSMSVIQRMELLVLSTLDWRMHSITPFHFIRYFISCFCKESSPQKQFVSLISQIICAAVNDVNIIACRSSTIAMAATLMAIDQGLSREAMEIKVEATCVNQLFDHADMYPCYSRMLNLEPLKVNNLRSNSANNEENPSKGREYIKRKRP